MTRKNQCPETTPRRFPGCEKPWVFGILPMGSGFLPKTQGFDQKSRVFAGFLGFCSFSGTAGAQSAVIHIIDQQATLTRVVKQHLDTTKPKIE